MPATTEQMSDHAEDAAVCLDRALRRLACRRMLDVGSSCQIIDSEASAYQISEESVEVEMRLRVRVRVPRYPNPEDIGVDALSALGQLAADAEVELKR